MGKKFMGYDNASELLTAIGNKIKAKYTKPNTGIPKSDLSSDIQNSLVDVVDNGAKNFLQIPDLETLKALNIEVGNNVTWDGTSASESGVTFTVDYANNTVKTSGTSTAKYPRLIINKFTFEDGVDYILSGCPSGGSETGYSMSILQQAMKDKGSGVTITGTGQTWYIMVYCATSGIDMSDLVFKPMICTKAEYDISPKHEPHALGNQFLTPTVIEQVNSGAKNKINYNGSPWNSDLARLQAINVNGTWSSNTFTMNGVTATINSDGTITTSGTVPTGSSFYFTFVDFTTATSAYIGDVLSGCPNGGDYSTKYALYLADASGNTLIHTTSTSGVVIPSTPVRLIRILGRSGTNMNGLTFKPMICTLADWNASQKFVPHCKSNYELTQYTDGCTLDTVSKSSGSLDDIATNAFAVYNASVTGKPVDDDGNTSAFTGLCKTDIYNSSEAMQTLRRLSNSHTWVRTKTASTWNPWIKQGVAPYIVSRNTASASNLLYDAAKACGLSPTAKIYSGMISVTTDTNGESLLVFFTYKHGVYADAQSITNKVISYAGTINNLGTFGISGGTAPYTFSVMFFN